MRMTISNKGLLENLSPYWISAIKNLLTIDNPEYKAAQQRLLQKGSKRKVFGIPRKLYFFENVDINSLLFPRGAAGLIHQTVSPYEKIEFIDASFALPKVSFKFNGELREYQEQAVNGILPKRFGILEAGTGSGKTVMAISIIASRKQPTLIIVHTKELLYQWQERLKTFLKIDCGLIGDGLFDVQPVTVGIVNTVGKRIDKLKDKFGHLIVDECHRVPASLFKNVVDQIPCRYLLGLSATPYRNDGLEDIIGWYMGTHRITIDPHILKEVGAILVPDIIIRETTFGYRSKKSDYQTLLSELINDKIRNNMIINDIRKEAKIGNISLVVSDRIEHLCTLAEKLKIKSAILTGGTKPEIRKEVIQQLSQGEIKILLSTSQLIGEGFDCPGLTNLFITMPIKYEGKLTQIIGRILRPVDGKEPKVYDYFDRCVAVLKKQGLQRQNIYSTL
jgi:superfamily II DNA or RNA helicase